MESQSTQPTKKKQPKRKYSALAIGAIGVLFIIGAWLVTLPQSLQFAREGVPTTATAVRCSDRPNAFEKVVYDYSARSAEGLTERFRDSETIVSIVCEEGQTLEILYLPEQPQRSTVVNNQFRRSAWVISPLLLIVMSGVHFAQKRFEA